VTADARAMQKRRCLRFLDRKTRPCLDRMAERTEEEPEILAVAREVVEPFSAAASSACIRAPSWRGNRQTCATESA